MPLLCVPTIVVRCFPCYQAIDTIGERYIQGLRDTELTTGVSCVSNDFCGPAATFASFSDCLESINFVHVSGRGQLLLAKAKLHAEFRW